MITDDYSDLIARLKDAESNALDLGHATDDSILLCEAHIALTRLSQRVAELESKLQTKSLEYLSLFDQCSEAEKHAAEVSSLNFDLEAKCALLAASLDQADKRIEAYEAGLTDGVDDEKAALIARVEELEAKLADREGAEPVVYTTPEDMLLAEQGLRGSYGHDEADGEIPLYAHPPAAAASEDTARLDFLEKCAVIAKAGQTIRAAIDQAMSEPWGPGTNTGHGHLWPRPDGLRARCAGPGLCPICAQDKSRLEREKKE